MYVSEDYYIFEVHPMGEKRLTEELERRRVIAARLAESAQLVDPSARHRIRSWLQSLAHRPAALAS